MVGIQSIEPRGDRSVEVIYLDDSYMQEGSSAWYTKHIFTNLSAKTCRQRLAQCLESADDRDECRDVCTVHVGH